MSADDFFSALRELAHLNKVPQFFTASLPAYQQVAQNCDYLISVTANAKEIQEYVQQVVDAGHVNGYNALRD